MNPLWGIAFFFFGFGIAVPLTYLWTVHRRRLNAFEETLKAATVEAFQRGKDEAMRGFTFEQSVCNSRRGIIWKSTHKVVSERVLLNGIPITPFYEYAVQIDETLDPSELGHVANAVRISMGLPSLSELGVRSLPEGAAKKLS